MHFLRGLLAVAFIGAAVWIMLLWAEAGSSRAGFLLVCAVSLALMALAIGLRPWRRAWGFLLCLAAIPPLTLLAGSTAPLVPIAALVVIGAILRGLASATVPRAAADLEESAAVDRKRGLEELEFLIANEYGPGLRNAFGVLQAATASPHEDVRVRAEALVAELVSRTPPDDDAPEAAASTEDAPVAGEAPAEPLPSALAAGAPRPEADWSDDAPVQPGVEELIAILRTGDPAPCRAAIARLVEIGAEAIPALEAAAEAGDPDLRVDALEALRLIGGDLE